MKIAVTSEGPTLEHQVDSKFGRSPYHLFIETDDMSFEAVKNPNEFIKPCAGAFSAKLFAQKGVQAILSGHCAPAYCEMLQKRGIQVILGVTGKVRDAVEHFKKVQAVIEQARASKASAGS